MTVQVAGSLVLLIAAGLFVRSLNNARRVDLGIRPEGVLNLAMDLAQQGYDQTRGETFFRELKHRVGSLPGVRSVSWAFAVPFGYYRTCDYVDVEQRPVAQSEGRPTAACNFVGEDYFQTLGVSLLRGRGITEQDTADSRPVAVINQTMAQRFWPGEEALGRRFSYTGPQGPWLEVVGIAGNGKYTFIFEDPTLYFYAPLAQNYRSMRTLQLRVEGVPAASVTSAVRSQVRTLDADLALYDVRTMTEALQGGNGFFLLRVGAGFAAALGGLGLLLAAVGVYGVVSSVANQRTREIGVRMALGADRPDVLKLMMGQGLGLVLAGLVTGALASLGAARFIEGLLFGVATHDPLTFGAVSLLLGAAGLAACAIPALRASRLEPVSALRSPQA